MEDKPLNLLSLLGAPAQPKQPAMVFEAPFKDETVPDDVGGSANGSYPAGIVVRPWAVRRLICPGCECISTDADSIIGHDNEFNCPALSQELGLPRKVSELCRLTACWGFVPPGFKRFSNFRLLYCLLRCYFLLVHCICFRPARSGSGRTSRPKGCRRFLYVDEDLRRTNK